MQAQRLLENGLHKMRKPTKEEEDMTQDLANVPAAAERWGFPGGGSQGFASTRKWT